MSEQATVRRAAITLLTRREYPKGELFNKLRHKGFNEEAINETIASLEAEGIINEQRFVENFIDYQCSKGYGPLHIHRRLTAYGITSNLIEDQLKITDNNWFDKIRQVWQKRFKGKMPQDFKARAQQMRFLQYRGFTSEQIESIFKAKGNI